ncbi:hypothetical protein BDZ97DRAFT_1923765 [Flammula alnicola]|nr:hypothetical protein BDZ97DRAFT_1923765 [Flammula alnicola]
MEEGKDQAKSPGQMHENQCLFQVPSSTPTITNSDSLSATPTFTIPLPPQSGSIQTSSTHLAALPLSTQPVNTIGAHQLSFMPPTASISLSAFGNFAPLPTSNPAYMSLTASTVSLASTAMGFSTSSQLENFNPAAVNLSDLTYLKTLKRKMLNTLCFHHDLPAKGTNADIISSLHSHFTHGCRH